MKKRKQIWNHMGSKLLWQIGRYEAYTSSYEISEYLDTRLENKLRFTLWNQLRLNLGRLEQ